MTSASDRVTACRECGKADEANYLPSTRNRMLRDQLCFGCLYWIKIIEEGRGPEVVIAAGHYYAVHPYVEKGRPRHSLGYGGAVFYFRFKDGREVRSNDVWNGSPIPARFRKRLPDNAVRLDDQGQVLRPAAPSKAAS